MKRTDLTQSTIQLLRPFCILAPAYVALIFLLPANPVAMKSYGLEAAQYHVLLFSVALPYLLVWFGAFLAYARLQQYTNALRKTPEGKDFQNITHGVMYLAYGLPMVAILSLCLNTIGNNISDLKAVSIVIINYISLIVPLLAYNVMRRGTHGLVGRAKFQFSLGDMRSIMMILVIIGVAYCYFTFKKLNLESIGSSNNPYYLPAWLMITTVIIPYLYAWFSGLLAAYELVVFGRHVQGVLYRQAMRWLASGTVAMVAGSVALQYLRTVVPRTGHLSINTGLMVALSAYIILSIGFVLIVIGATRLKRIEEV